MSDDYNALARRLGIPALAIPQWRAAAGAPPLPPPPRPSYEGVNLADLGPKPQAPIGPPAPPTPPRPSYEGATLQGMAPPPPTGVSLAEPPKAPMGAPAPRMGIKLATGDNIASAPASLSPAVMKQVNRVADNSAAAQTQTKATLEENERKKNLDGATFAEGSGSQFLPQPGGGGGAPVLVDPGGRRPASWQVTEGLDLGPEAAAAVGSADEHGRTAARLDYDSGKAAADFERGYLEQHAQAADKFASEETARTEKYQQQVGEHMSSLDGLRAQIREAKVDPYDGMNPAVARIGGAIAVALGAFASKHGENAGLEAVKAGIAQNVEKQTQSLNKLERGASGEVNFLGQLKQQFGDTGAAQQALYIAYLERSKTELAKKLGDPSVADPRLLAGYDRLQAKLDDELIRRTAEFKGITQDRVVRHDVNAQPRYAGGGGAKQGKPDELFVPMGPNGQGFQARSEKEAQAARGLASAKQQISPMLERLIKLRSETNAGERLADNKGMYESERMAQIKSLQAQVSLGLRELSASSPGAMDKGMQELAGQIQGNWTSVQGNPEAAAKEFLGSINRQLDSYARGQGAQNEQQGLTYDPHGNIVTKSVGRASFSLPKGELPKSFRKVDDR